MLIFGAQTAASACLASTLAFWLGVAVCGWFRRRSGDWVIHVLEGTQAVTSMMLSRFKYVSELPRSLLVVYALVAALLGLLQLRNVFAFDGVGRLVSILGVILWGLLSLFWVLILKERRRRLHGSEPA